MESALQSERGRISARPRHENLSPDILSRSSSSLSFGARTRSSSTCPSGQHSPLLEASLSEKLGEDDAAAEKRLIEAACAAEPLSLPTLSLAAVRTNMAALALELSLEQEAWPL